MKSKHPIRILVFFLILSGFAYGQQTVTLVCNPNAIEESGATGACYFLGGEDVNPEEFTTYASVGETLTWVGQSTSEEDSIDVTDLPHALRFSVNTVGDVNRSLLEVQREHIIGVLHSVDGNKTKAAEILGINRKTLREKIKKLKLSI